jgi:hypothetical protein
MSPTAWMYQAVVCCGWSDSTTPATPYGRANSTPTTIGGRDGILTLSYSGKPSWRSGLISTRAMSCDLISLITVIASRVRSCARVESWSLVVGGVGVEKGCWSRTPNSDPYGFACEPSYIVCGTGIHGGVCDFRARTKLVEFSGATAFTYAVTRKLLDRTKLH